MNASNPLMPPSSIAPDSTPVFDKSTHKRCSCCKEVLLRSHFANDSSKPDGKRYRCRACLRKQVKANGNRLDVQRRYDAKPELRFKKYQRSAAERGFAWNLTKEQFMEFWQVPCVHCGSPIKTIGLDRIDSNLPYQDGNVEPCCFKCNAAKSAQPTVEWYAHMEKIRKHVGGFVSGANGYL
jgi:hypothetical protein